MNKEEKSKANIIKEFFSGVVKVFPFIERVSQKSESEIYNFSKLCIIIFSLFFSFIYILFNAYRMADFAPFFLLVIIVLFSITILSPFMSLRLKMKGG